MLYCIFNVLMTFSLRSWYFWAMNFVCLFLKCYKFSPHTIKTFNMVKCLSLGSSRVIYT